MLLINLAATILLLCSVSAQKVGNVIYHLQSFETSDSSMPYATWASPAAYDSYNKRIWVVGGYSCNYNTQSLVQYYDVQNEATAVATGSLWSGNINYNTNSMVYNSAQRKLWYGTYQQMCYFDVQTITGNCAVDWYYPSYTWGPTLTSNTHYPNIIYVASNYYSFWSFDVNKAAQNNYPWRTGPNQKYYRYDYPCATFWNDGDQDWVYMHGGSWETTSSERINVTQDTFGVQWISWGGLPTYMYGSACQTYDRLVYILSGEQDYSYTSNVLVYDMKTGKSKTTNVYLNRGRVFMGSASVPGADSSSVIYILNGQMYSYYYYCDRFLSAIEYSNTMTLPTPSPTEPPTRHPTKHPTKPPTRHPTKSPTTPPTRHPTNAPSRRPSKAPTNKPTKQPTKKPTTRSPTRKPTKSPTRTPTYNPTRHPTHNPTRHPSTAPTSRPTPIVKNDNAIQFEFWLKSWDVDYYTFAQDSSNKGYVEAAAHDALADSIENEVEGLPSYWRDLFTLTIKDYDDVTSEDTVDDILNEKATLFIIDLITGNDELFSLITEVLTTSRKIKSASRIATNYLAEDFDDSSMQAFYKYDGLTGESLKTSTPTSAPSQFEAFTVTSKDSVMNEPWFWIIIIVCILILFFGAMGLYLRHTSKKDKLRRQQNMMAIQKLASLSGGVPLNPMQAQQQQALTHALWLGGGGTGGTNTNSAGEAGENGGEGAGNHTQLLNDMLASKLKAQQANPASLAMGGGSSGMGMGMAPMGMGMGMGSGMAPMGMGMGGGMGMGMGMGGGMGMGMGMNPMVPQQFYNQNSIAGDLNNYMFNPAMMNMGMNWQEMAQMVAWQNQMLMAQANGKQLNPAMLSTDAMNIGGEEAGLSGGENEDANASNKLVDAMNLNTSDDGEKVQDYEE